MKELSNGRVRRTPEEWQDLVKRFSTSGVSKREFCRREKVNAESFGRWYKRLTAPEPEFVEVTSSTEPPSTSTWAMEVKLESGTIVRIRG